MGASTGELCYATAMRALRLLLTAAMLAGCAADRAAPRAAVKPDLVTAESFIDAFYSFDRARLRAAMADAPRSQGDTLYYQQWAEAGHYAILRREPCRFDKPAEVVCAITVRDDLIPALGLGLHVTDNFHFAFEGGRIVKVWNSSNDPPEFHQAMEWLRRERPEIFTGPCLGIWEGGPTPGDCERAVVKGFREFTARTHH
jgi:hypothetical protein